MEKKSTRAIILFSVIVLVTVGYFVVKVALKPTKVDTPTQVEKNVQLSDSILSDSVIVDSVVLDELPLVETQVETTETFDVEYYVVVGSFKYEMNAINFVNTIDNSGIIYNDSYHMVYLYKTDDMLDATNVVNTNKDTYNGIWVYKNN